MLSLYDRLAEMVSGDEGRRLDVYMDTEGNPTVGRGHKVTAADNLQVGDVIDAGREAQMFDTDIRTSIAAAKRAIPDLEDRPVEFQAAVANTLLQLGANADTHKFPKAFGHLRSGDTRAAITEFGLNEAGDGPSDWSKQTPNRFDAQMARLRDSIGPPEPLPGPPEPPEPEAGLMGQPTLSEPEAPADKGLMEPVHDARTREDFEAPEWSWSKVGDELDGGIKALSAGIWDTVALAARVVDGPLELHTGTIEYANEASKAIRESIPDWIKEDISREIIVDGPDGGWEIDWPSFRKVAHTILESAGPGGAIAVGGKGLAKMGAKALPGMFTKFAKSSKAASYGLANSAYISADSYQNAYDKVYGDAVAEGMTPEEAKAEGETAGQFAALWSGILAFGTGTIGGFAMSGGAAINRMIKGAALGSMTEAIEEPGQYVAEQLAAGDPVDPREVGARAIMGAFASGPMEGLMAGLAGEQEVNSLARAAGEKLVDDVLLDSPEITAPMDPLNLNTEFHETIEANRPPLPDDLPAQPPLAPPPVAGVETPPQPETMPANTVEEPVDLVLTTASVPGQVTDPATAEPNVYMDEAGNVWDQDGNPAERPESYPASVPIEGELMTGRKLPRLEGDVQGETIAEEFSKLYWGRLETNPADSDIAFFASIVHEDLAGRTGEEAIAYLEAKYTETGSPTQEAKARAAADIRAKIMALPALDAPSSAPADPVTDAGVEEGKPAGPAKGVTEAPLEGTVVDKVSKGAPSPRTRALTAAREGNVKALRERMMAEGNEDVRALVGRMTDEDLASALEAGDTSVRADHPDANEAMHDERVMNRLMAHLAEYVGGTPAPKLTKKQKKEQADLDALETKVAEAAETARAKKQVEDDLAALEEEEMLGEAGMVGEEIDPADAAVEAYAKRLQEQAETEPAPEQTPEQLDEQLNEEARAEAGQLRGTALTEQLNARDLSRAGTVAVKQERLAMAIKTEKMAELDAIEAPAPLTTDTTAVESAAETDAKKALAKKQATWDTVNALIMSKKKPEVKAILAAMNMDTKGGVAILRQRLLDTHGPRPEAPVEPAAGPAVASPSTETPATPTDGTAEAPAPVQPTEDTAPAIAPEPPKRGHIIADKPNAIDPAIIKKHWGDKWQSKVFRIQVGKRIYTAWKSRRISIDGIPVGGKGGTYVAVEAEPNSFNPTVELPPGVFQLGTTRIKPDGVAKITEVANAAHNIDVDNYLAEQQLAEQPTTDHIAMVDEARTLANRVIDERLVGEELITIAKRIFVLGQAASRVNTQAKNAIGGEYRRVREAFKRDQMPGDETQMDTIVAEGVYADQQVERLKRTQVADIAQQQRRTQENQAYAATQVRTEDDLNPFEKAQLAKERNRGIAFETLRYRWRAARGTKTQKDYEFEQSQGREVIDRIMETPIRELLQQFRRGEVLSKSTMGIDQRMALREAQDTLAETLPDGKLPEKWDINGMIDAVVPKVKHRMTLFKKNNLDPYLERLKADGITHEQMTEFAGALSAMWRNQAMVVFAQDKASADNMKAQKVLQVAQNDFKAKHAMASTADRQTTDGRMLISEASKARVALKLAQKAADATAMRVKESENRQGHGIGPRPDMSGVTDEQIQEVFDRLVPTPVERAKYAAIFKDHYHKTAKLLRAEFRDGGLVPEGRVDKWEAEFPADPFTLPAANDLQRRAKIIDGFRGTYTPLQHEAVDYNLAQVEANLRKKPEAHVNDVAGNEVRAAAGQAPTGRMPQYIWERMQENLYTAYGRRGLNDVHRTMGEMIVENPNVLLWSNITQTEEQLEAEMAEVELDEFGLEVEPVFMPDSMLRDPANIPGSEQRRALGVSDARSVEFLPIRYKDANGRQAINRVHSAQLEAAFEAEAGLDNLPTKIAGKWSRWVSKVHTAWVASFLAAQLPKDFLSAKALLPTDIAEELKVSKYPAVGRAYWDVMQDKPIPDNASEAYKRYRTVIEEQYLKSGAHTTFFTKARMEDHYTGIKDAMQALDEVGPENAKEYAQAGWRLFKAGFQFLDDANTVAENIPRIIAFTSALDKGRSLHQARSIARELNVNFSTMGTRGAQINSYFPFWNATTSGNAINYRALKKSKRYQKFALAYAGIGLMNGIVQSIMSGEDDDGRSRYWNLPEYVRNTNLVIWMPWMDQPFKIPLPYGLNVFTTLGDSMAEMMLNPEATASSAMGRSLITASTTYNPIASSDVLRSVTPSIAEGPLDLLRNRDFFGSPIAPDQREGAAGNLSPSFNVRKGGSRGPLDATAQAVTQGVSRMTGGSEYERGVIDVSPDKLQYVFGTVTGGAGKQISRTLDALTLLVTGNVSDAAARAPILRRFFGGSTDFNNATRYYEQRDKLIGIQNQRTLLRKNRRRNPEAYADFMLDNKDYYDRGVMRKFEATEKRMRKLMSTRRKLRGRPDRSDRDNDRLEKLNTKIDESMVTFNRYYFERFVKGELQ